MTFNIKRNGFRNYRQQFSRNPAEGKPVVMDFWAPWCGPCKMVGPIIDELATEYEGKVIIGKCDVDENGDVAAEYGIRNIPTVLFLQEWRAGGQAGRFCSEICLRGQDRSDIIRYYLTIYDLPFRHHGAAK